MMPAGRIFFVCASASLLGGCALSGEGVVARPAAAVSVPFVADSAEIGTLTIVEEYGALVVDARMTAPWSIAGAQIYAGAEGLPLTHGGSPEVERFPYAIELPQPVTDYSLELPLSAVGAACGDSLTAAVRLSVVAQTPDGPQARVVWARSPDGGPALVLAPECTTRAAVVADGEIFYEEISDEFVEETPRRKSVAEN